MAERVLSYVTESFKEYENMVDLFVGLMFEEHKSLSLVTKKPEDPIMDPIRDMLLRYGKLRHDTDTFACFVHKGGADSGFQPDEKPRLIKGVLHAVQIADPNKSLVDIIKGQNRLDCLNNEGMPIAGFRVGYKLEYKEGMLLASIAHPNLGRYFL